MRQVERKWINGEKKKKSITALDKMPPGNSFDFRQTDNKTV